MILLFKTQRRVNFMQGDEGDSAMTRLNTSVEEGEQDACQNSQATTAVMIRVFLVHVLLCFVRELLPCSGRVCNVSAEKCRVALRRPPHCAAASAYRLLLSESAEAAGPPGF